MKWLVGQNSLLSERKSKQYLNGRMNVKMTLWPNKEEWKEDRLGSTKVKKDRRKNYQISSLSQSTFLTALSQWPIKL